MNAENSPKALFFVGGCSGTRAPDSGKPTIVGGKLIFKKMTRPTFGGFTSSFGVVVGSIGFFIDNGQGISNVVGLLRKCEVSKVFGLQTHRHKDHWSETHNNPYFFQLKNLLGGFYCPKLVEGTFAEAFETNNSKELWPLVPDHIPLEEFEHGATLDCGGIKVRTFGLIHPNGCAGYRIPTPKGDIVVATDNEIGFDKSKVKPYADFISGSSVVYIDVQYRDAEYTGKQALGFPISRAGWGHSTPSMVKKALALCAEPPKKILFGHHDPVRTEDDLCRFEAEVAAEFAGYNVTFARECECVQL